VAEHEFIDRLFYFWDVDCRGALSFQDLISGLDGVMHNGLMENIEWFFNLHDKNKDGYMTKDEVLTLSESLLFIFRYEIGDAYLGAISRFMSNVFEFGDALLPQSDLPSADPDTIGPNQPYLNLATFRMVVLADEVLESFFETDLSKTFRLETVPGIELPESSSGTASLLGGLWQAVATEDNKKIFNRITDEFGKTIGRHQVIHKPSIGRYTTIEEPKARESLLTPAMRHSTSKPSLKSESTVSVATTTDTKVSTTVPAPIAEVEAAVAAMKLAPKAQDLKMAPSPSSPELPIYQAANAALMERATFAIDDAGDEDEISDDELEDGEDDVVMDEVDAFLEAHDSGLSEADKALAKGDSLVVYSVRY
jgi:hypothetical protein